MDKVKALGSNALRRDLKNLLTSGEDCDVIITVQDRKFRTHKTILRARSPVFSTMLSPDMFVNQNGVIDIDDCDPDDFQKFLICLYSGELEIVSMDSAFNIYSIGDNYAVEEVKKNCETFMRRYLSVENICDIFTFTQRHKESEILKAASKFFVKNLKAILATEKWLDFLREHPEHGNELYVKAVDYYISKKPKSFFHLD